MRVCVQSKHLLDESMLEKIWRLSADEECFQDWLKRPVSRLGEVFIKNNCFYIWANYYKTNHGLRPVLDPEVFGAPIEQRFVEEEKSDADATLSRLNSLAARLAQLKQRRG